VNKKTLYRNPLRFFYTSNSQRCNLQSSYSLEAREFVAHFSEYKLLKTGFCSRPALFCIVTQCREVNTYPHFGTTHRTHLQVSRSTKILDLTVSSSIVKKRLFRNVGTKTISLLPTITQKSAGLLSVEVEAQNHSQNSLC